MKSLEEKAKEIAVLLEDGKGKDVKLLDVAKLNDIFRVSFYLHRWVVFEVIKKT